MTYIPLTPMLRDSVGATTVGLVLDSMVHSTDPDALASTFCAYQHVHLLSERPIGTGHVYFDMSKQKFAVGPEVGCGYLNRFLPEYQRVEASTDPSLGLPGISETVLAAYSLRYRSPQLEFRLYLDEAEPQVRLRAREFTGRLYPTDGEPRDLTLAELVEVGVGQIGSSVGASAFSSGYLLNDGQKSAHHFYSAPDWAIYGTNEWVPNEQGRLAVNEVMGKEHYKGGEDYLPGSIIIYKREDFLVK